MESPDPALDRATEAVEGAEPVGEMRLGDMARSLAQTALRSRGNVRRAAGLGREAVRVAIGRSEIAPAKGDLRFRDPAWQDNPAYRRVMQLYLAWAQEVDRSSTSADLEWRDTERARFLAAIRHLVAVAPTNTLPGNPQALKRVIETGGVSLARGARNLVHDVRHNGGMPSTGRHRERSRSERPRRDPGRGGLPRRGLRGHPVHADDAADARPARS